MNKRLIQLIIAANLLACLWLVLRYPHLMISPGETLDVHHKIAEDCFACHSPFSGSDEHKCIDCHALDQIGLTSTEGVAIAREEDSVAFHQKLLSNNCMGCHKEHHGLFEIQLVPYFSHQLLKQSLRDDCSGCHQVPDEDDHHATADNCSVCHGSDAWQPARFDHGRLEGQPARTCASCHQAPDDKLHRQFSGQCQRCHGTEAWEPADYDHDQYFRFDRHHKPRCDNCHIDGNLERYNCYDCHEHSERGVRREHHEEGIRDFEDCTECHRSGDEDEAERIWKRMRSKGKNARQEHDD